MVRHAIIAILFALSGCGNVFGLDDTSCDPTRSACGIDAGPTDGPAPPAEFPSCENLSPTCGPSGSSSCCETALVTGGTFFRGYDVSGDSMFKDMSKAATVSDFRLDNYEVTVGRFRKFVNAGMGTKANPPPAGAGQRTLNQIANQGGWDPSWNGNLAATTDALRAALKCGEWTDAPGANESLPIGCLDWFAAMAFCVWDGGFLPTQAEQSYAASGGGEHRVYPWSSPPNSETIDCNHVNYYNGSEHCLLPGGRPRRPGSLSPTGDGRWGQSDLAGNMGEWALDWYSLSPPTPCNNCANLTGTDKRVMGPGYWGDGPSGQRSARSIGVDLTLRTFSGGVRCARLPKSS